MFERIGDFEKLTGISKATLRYYDREGLLFPERSDGNNYRGYSEADLIHLVQVRQLSGFGIPLSGQPAAERSVSRGDVLALLETRQLEIEKQIEDLYELEARVKLHVLSYQTPFRPDAPPARQHMVGTYRMMLTEPDTRSHPNTPAIVSRWMCHTPYTYSVLRIRKEELQQRHEGIFHADIGIGLLKSHFDRLGETFEEPMRFSPPNKCLQYLAEVENIHALDCATLSPIQAFLEQNGLIPIDDLYGWIVYAPGGEKDRRYRVSMRVAIG